MQELTGISRKLNPICPNCTVPMTSEQPDVKGSRENTIAAAFIYFTICLILLQRTGWHNLQMK